MELSDSQFEEILAEAIDKVPKPYGDHIDNVAFILEDLPSPAQRAQLNLHPHQTLFGLYEGVSLPARNGMLKLLPDKITIFKLPLLAASRNIEELRRNIGHTVWHEVAHYFGLDHAKIDELDNKRRKTNS